MAAPTISAAGPPQQVRPAEPKVTALKGRPVRRDEVRERTASALRFPGTPGQRPSTREEAAATSVLF